MKPVRLQVLATGLLFLLPGLARAAAPPAGSPPAPLAVTNLKDSGPGSLRQAIADDAAGSTINFSVTGTITLSSGALTIAKNLDIEGPGPDKLTVSGNQASRVFVIQSGTVTLAGMTIANGLANGSSPDPPSAGGGVLNAASAALALSHDILAANRALGDASKSPLGFPGAGLGGGVMNFGTLQVSACQFTGNLARGADGTSGPGGSAGGSVGGGILNWQGKLTVSGSTFGDNQAIAGNGNLSPLLSGEAEAGAIASVGALVVSGSRFSHNQAIGGNGNQVTLPVARELGPGKAAGGAIAYAVGTGTISGCTLDHNQAIGGAGGAGGYGGVGVGGGIYVEQDPSQKGGSLTVSNCAVHDNLALGGAGGPGGDGGEGRGGGLISYLAAPTLTVNSSSVQHNLALGGAGGAGGNGGNGLGGGLYGAGGLYGLAASVLSLAGATVSDNLAQGGAAGAGGSAGQGIGGGVYHLGTFNADSTTVIAKNQASTSDNDLGPVSAQ